MAAAPAPSAPAAAAAGPAGGRAADQAGGLDVQGRQLLARCRKAATAYGRTDLALRLEQTADRLADDAVRVMIVG